MKPAGITIGGMNQAFMVRSLDALWPAKKQAHQEAPFNRAKSPAD